MEQPNLAVLLLLFVVFLFVGVSLFIIIIQQIASQLELKGQFMEIVFLLFPVQQLSKKIIRHLLNKVLLRGVLIYILSLIGV